MFDHLKTTYDMLNSAFPNGISEDDYFSVLFILSEEISFRNIAKVISDITNREYEVVYNDVLGAVNLNRPVQIKIEDLKIRLNQFCYNEWLNEPI